MTRNVCPINGDYHRYFIHNSAPRIEYVPVRADSSLSYTEPGEQAVHQYQLEHDLYEKVETALLGCACGDVIKEVVRSAVA